MKRKSGGVGGVYPRRKKGKKGVSAWRLVWYDRRGERCETTMPGHLSKTEAQAVWKKRSARAVLEREGVCIAADTTTVDQAADEFFEYKSTRNKASTMTRYRGTYERFLKKELGSTRLSYLDEVVIDGWWQRTKKKRFTAKRTVATDGMCRAALKLLRSIVRLAARRGLFGPEYQGEQGVKRFRVPWSGFEMPEVIKKRRPAVRTEAGVASVISAASRVGGTRLALACALGLFAGSRRGELRSKKWGRELKFMDGELEVPPEKATALRVFVRGKDAKDKEWRMNRISDPAIVAIARKHYEVTRAWIAENGLQDQGWVFVATRPSWREGIQVTSAGSQLAELITTKQWTAIRQTAGLSEMFRFHDLRGSFAKNLLAAGRSLVEVSERLGHTSVETTMIYLREIGGAELFEAADALAGLGGSIVLDEVKKKEKPPMRKVAARLHAGAGVLGARLVSARARLQLRQSDVGKALQQELGGSAKTWQKVISRLEKGPEHTKGMWRPKDRQQARAAGRVLGQILGDESISFLVAGLETQAGGTERHAPQVFEMKAGS